MRTSRGWPVAALAAVALLCGVVAVCADPTGTASPDGAGRAVEDEGGELAMMAAGSGGVDVDPFTPRLALAISADGDLLPDAPVTLTISGEAREEIDGGEVVFRLPTKAAMDHAGPGRQPYYPLGDTVPTEASWRLPKMGAGDRWERTVTVPAAAAGYYMAAVAADTDGPESALGPYLFDESYARAWMFVSATGGQLTDVLEDSLFPEGVRPVPGPFMTEAELLGRPVADGEYKSLWIEVNVYYDGHGYSQPAVGVELYGWLFDEDGKLGSNRYYVKEVPEDGFVEFPCPTEQYPYWKGFGTLPETEYIRGRDRFISRWSAHRNSCDSRKVVGLSISAPEHEYMAWRNLNDVIPRINAHFGYSRDRLKWEVDLDTVGAWFKWFCCGYEEHVVFGRDSYYSAWPAAHEYTHALHYKSMGSFWRSDDCSPHYYYLPSSYTCAFKEGLADYGGWVGAPDEHRRRKYELETIRDSTLVDGEWVPTTPKPQVEAHVAALFHDLIDGGTGNPDTPTETAEPEDKTRYSSRYVMKVFATCQIKQENEWWPDSWEMRNDVSDFVWCLENRVNSLRHGLVFPGIDPPEDVKEKATEPADWNPDSIRSTWLWNMQ